MSAIESETVEASSHTVLAAAAVPRESPDREIAREVCRAISEDRLLFQPEVVCAIDDRTDILYREMLVRMKVGDTVLLPGRFIPALEKLSLMRPFDCFVVRHTLEAIKATPGVTIGCNVSAQSARDDPWWQEVFLELENDTEAASRLVVEITESAPFAPIAGPAFVRRLQRMGVRVAIDDFGAGFSAGTANSCATDIIKVDRSFLRRVRQGALCVAELSRLIGIAQGMAPLVVLEGVETPDDIRIARDTGVHWIQGYYVNASRCTSPTTC
ncbi:EAL domain-containing protein [Paraburkholderia lycopersici]|uniref:EAL domain, c-di-GMP-specific phosphodiesterase class I (Or its enzymatically inactive variant) n=1 Tax=Paraburkholderia lycopersici TaxID=416944 RepID=A0A1G6W8U4_9BURK|nr:EAL domain-containing protein [Paraburkholderia lycopersici]SDD61647.1 EAL domain, c-di-GMP-specific phosphodiesterase class I (or its enzymatically inactive variant) [Paraburkholderia lycopersici]